MTRDELVSALAAQYPLTLAADLVDEFLQIRQDFLTSTLGRTAPGKFVENLVRALQHRASGNFDPRPNVDGYLRTVESEASLDEGLRICAARVGRSMYTLRNKRGIAHSGAVDPSSFDLTYLFHAAQWIMAELLRTTSSITMEQAGRLIAGIQAPATVLVEKIGAKDLVLAKLNIQDEILVLLHSTYPTGKFRDQIQAALDRRSPKSVSNALRKLWAEKRIDESAGAVALTRKGYGAAEAVIARLLADK